MILSNLISRFNLRFHLRVIYLRYLRSRVSYLPLSISRRVTS